MKPAPKALTPEQLEALTAYAAEHGRTWKDSLRTDWYYARRPGALQQIRNEFGPTWLMTFKFPKEA